MLVMLTPRKRSAKRRVEMKDLYNKQEVAMVRYCQAKNEDLELH